jgi:HTH-type transcriptional repressor of NAD biosynthesis genes
MKRGLIVGKFYPPHRGHKHLIDTARAQVDHLSVIICRKPNEDPPGALRADWLRQIHPDVRVILIDDELDADDSRLWAENSIRWLGYRPDIAFTSEDYGDAFAHYLGCQHVQVDKPRNTVPISGTAVRSNPYDNWDYIEPPVRAYYAKRVCLVGAESTGKTTLAAQLAKHFQTIWVPEYGREYSEAKLAADGQYNWVTEEFEHIAKTQCEHENKAAGRSNKILICDTDAFATSIWHQRYFGAASPAVDAIATKHRKPDLYLLTDINTPFVQDGTRDGEHIREWMHQTFVTQLTDTNRPFKLLDGNFEVRLQKAIHYIEQLFK